MCHVKILSFEIKCDEMNERTHETRHKTQLNLSQSGFSKCLFVSSTTGNSLKQYRISAKKFQIGKLSKNMQIPLILPVHFSFLETYDVKARMKLELYP